MIYMHKRLKSFEQMVKMQCTSQEVKHVENSYGERESYRVTVTVELMETAVRKESLNWHVLALLVQPCESFSSWYIWPEV